MEVFPNEWLSLPSITYTDISESISRLRNDSSGGPDGIPSCFLKHCLNNLLKPLHIIFNKCIRLGKFPSFWKRSKVVPIFKSGSRSEVANYRPISINNNFAKVFDSILARIVTAHAKEYIIDMQHGFTAGKSTETNLFIFTNFITESIENGFSVDCIYTDLKKAFDRVPINLLMDKLRTFFKICDPLLSCIRDSLCNRFQQISINGFTSLPISVTSGVGQGTHLGPILFLLFINDIKSSFRYSQFLLFADDCKIFVRTSSVADLSALQEDLNSFFSWCNANGLELNISKCKHMRFTRRSNPLHFNFSINGHNLDTVSCVKDLGVLLDTKLSFNTHIDGIVSRASKLLGYIRRTTTSFSNLRCLVILYTAFVRSITDYCSIIWSPYYHIHINRLEAVQRKFVKMLCFKFGFDYDSNNYDVLVKYFSLQPLARRRVFSDVMFVFKVLNGIVKCPNILAMFSLYMPTRTLRKFPLLAVDFHRTNYGLHCPLTRIANELNSLHLSENDLNVSLTSFRPLLCHLVYNY